MAVNNSRYQGNLQERLRLLSTRTNCPTRQENGQRYLGPPVDWTSKPPTNSEVFISKLPADCFEDEIYDFCSQAGKIYLLRLMINFENENRGFCFVTYSNPKEAATAIAILPQKSLRKGLHIHAEISLNNCTLKMYGLDFKWKDEELEKEIRANTKDVVNVTIKRNMSQRTLMATLYFDTHQKAAIARRKLSQIANSRWGQNVKVFLWSKKLQNRNSNKQDYDDSKEKRYKQDRFEDRFPTHNPTFPSDVRSYQSDNYNTVCQYASTVNLFDPICRPWVETSSSVTEDDYLSANKLSSSTNYVIHKYDNDFTYDLNNNVSSPKYNAAAVVDPFTLPGVGTVSDSHQISPSASSHCGVNKLLFPPSSESSPSHSKSSLSDLDSSLNWNTDMFPKPKTSMLDLRSPFDHSPESYSYVSESRFQDKQIEVILQEALEALARSSLNEGYE